MPLTAVIFDIGGVLVDWDPRHLYGELFAGDIPAMEHFLGTICTPAWHNRLDGGETFAALIAETVARFPHMQAMIQAYDHGWPGMFRGMIPGMPELVAELAATGLPLFAITNFPAEKFAAFAATCPVMQHFRDVLVSGSVGLTKPDPRIFELAVQRFGIEPATTLFIDDRAENVAAAVNCGFLAHQFTNAASLSAALRPALA